MSAQQALILESQINLGVGKFIKMESAGNENHNYVCSHVYTHKHAHLCMCANGKFLKGLEETAWLK